MEMELKFTLWKINKWMIELNEMKNISHHRVMIRIVRTQTQLNTCEVVLLTYTLELWVVLVARCQSWWSEQQQLTMSPVQLHHREKEAAFLRKPWIWAAFLVFNLTSMTGGSHPPWLHPPLMPTLMNMLGQVPCAQLLARCVWRQRAKHYHVQLILPDCITLSARAEITWSVWVKWNGISALQQIVF